MKNKLLKWQVRYLNIRFTALRESLKHANRLGLTIKGTKCYLKEKYQKI